MPQNEALLASILICPVPVQTNTTGRESEVSQDEHWRVSLDQGAQTT